MLLFFLFFLIYSNVYSDKNDIKKLLKSTDCNCNIHYDEKSDNLPPWQISLLVTDLTNNDNVICGATILNRKFILSSANCFKDYKFNNSRAFVSISRERRRKSDFLDSFNLSILEMNVDEFYVHYEYNEDHYLKSFILIELKDYLNFNNQLRPACLIDTKFEISFSQNILLLGGFGTNEEYLINENFKVIKPYFLKKYQHNFRFLNYTTKYFYYSNKIQEDVVYKFCTKKEILCALPFNKSACYGDQGGPLYLKKSNKFFVVAMNILNYPLFVNNTMAGIPAFGQCLRNSFNMFIRIEQAFNLIDKYIDKNAVCKIDVPYTLSTELRKPIFRRKSIVNQFCECTTERLKEISLNLLILGTDKAALLDNKDFRWVVQLISFNKDEYQLVCTGIIINNMHVLTQASCLFEYGKNGLFLYMANKPFESKKFMTDEQYIKAENFFFYPSFNIYSKTIADDIGIIRLSKKIDFEEHFHFKPACFPRDDDSIDYSLDSLFTLSWKMEIPGYKFPKPIGENPLYTMYHKIVGDSFYSNIEVCELNQATCIKTFKGINLGKSGAILHRFIRNSVQVLGFYRGTGKPEKEDADYQINFFTDIQPKLNWIYDFVGGPYEVCVTPESNKIINHTVCSCEYSLSDVDKPMPWDVSILRSFHDPKILPVPLCRGIILNEFWVFSTAECYFLYGKDSLYVVLNLNDLESTYFFLHGIHSGKIIMIDYVIYHPGYDTDTNENNIALYKLNRKIVHKHVNFLPACIINQVKDINYSQEMILIQVNEKLITLKQNSSISSNCNKKEFLCFQGLEENVCDNDMGSPVIRIINKKSYLIGYLSEKYKNNTCSLKTDYQITKISRKISWINSIIGELSYCIEDSFGISEKEDLCDCLVKNNEALITQHFSDLALVVICSCVILSEFYVAAPTSCFYKNFPIKNYLIVTDLNSMSEDKIFISDLKISPYRITHSFNNNSRITLLRTEKRLKLGGQTNFFPACLSLNKEPSKHKKDKFIFLRSQNSRSYIKMHQKTQVCDNINTYCVESEKMICASDSGISVKQIIKDEKKGVNKYLVLGLFERLLHNKFALMHKLRFDENWITKKIGLGRMCNFEEKQKETLSCNCQYEGPMGRIFNGSLALPKSIFSFMAHVVFVQNETGDDRKLGLICGGIIIHFNWILTSKNAIKPYALKELFVGLGNKFENSLKSYDVKNNLRGIKNIIYHNDTEVDLAMIEIYPDIELGTKTGTYAPCIAKRRYESFDEALLFVFGFGFTKNLNKTYEKSFSDLNFFKFSKYTDQQEMRKKYPKLCDEKKICLFEDSRSVCAGDAGGPLIQIKHNVIELIGIIYTDDNLNNKFDSENSCHYSKLSVFTLISNYYFWLIDVTKGKNFCQVYI